MNKDECINFVKDSLKEGKSYEDLREDIRHLYCIDGLNQTELGEIFEVSQRSTSSILKKLGIERTEEEELDLKLKEHPERLRICEVCGKRFYAEKLNAANRFCSIECFNKDKSKSVPSKEILEQNLIDYNRNYRGIGRLYGVSDNAVKKWCKKYGIHKPVLTYWDDVTDAESAQKKIDELGIKSASQLNDDFGGLADKIDRLGVRKSLVFPKSTEFDSSWEEKMFNLVRGEFPDLRIDHNKMLSPECKYINPLIFDIIFYQEENPKAVIEVQGPTHFIDVHGGLESQLARDKIKYDWCISNNIQIFYFTYEPDLLKDGYFQPVFTDESLLLENLRQILIYEAF